MAIIKVIDPDSATKDRPKPVTGHNVDGGRIGQDVYITGGLDEVAVTELPDIEIDLTPSTVTGGVKTVTTAGTGVALVSSTTAAQYVIITADVDNTGTIYVGGSDVDKTTKNGIPLTVPADGDGVKVPGSCIIPIADANDIWIDATVNGEGVNFVIVA